jgi:EAL domain-containing protein (putative c-di-GMP-specific phosphodiesterase class I)
LAYLRRFPFTLMIDRAFVNELLSTTMPMPSCMISQLATTLNMRTVAEGVESATQLAVVTDAGCHEVHGTCAACSRRVFKVRRD